MEVVTIQSEVYAKILDLINAISTGAKTKEKEPKDVFLDNQEFLQLMNISKRTAQSWRDNGVISFSQVGSKIYYRMEDVQNLLDSNHKQAFKKRK
ncbi:MAG: helix-turn-helix domain-containing protein [Methylotenera sp.]|nr:helix-turn-helix domain-containing protein [Flavobacterium sp.]